MGHSSSGYRRLLLVCCASVSLCVISACGRQVSVSLPAAQPSRPALEQVADAERALQLAGFDQAFVYRWQGGLLEGHVLDSGRVDARAPIETEEMARSAFRIVADQEGQKDGKARLDPAQISGLIVIAIRPKKADAPDRECIRAVSVRVEREGKVAELGTGLVVGSLPAFTDLVKGNQLCKLKLASGEERDLFELRLRSDVPPAK
jgi:hypothetical protein